MTPVPDFYVLLSRLFREIKDSPEELPNFPVTSWPIGSQERQLLEDFRDALITLKAWEMGLQATDPADQKVVETVAVEKLNHDGEHVQALEQTILLEISQTLASALELQPGLILDQLRMIVEYTHATLFALEDSALITFAVRLPQSLEPGITFRVPLDGPETLAVLFNQHQPILIENIWSADAAAQFLQSLLNHQAALLLEGVRAWMWVPLAVKGRVIGGIGVGHTEPGYFTSHHADLALTVANDAAITMLNAELYEHAKALAALEERQHLAQNLHDAINQSLFLLH